MDIKNKTKKKSYFHYLSTEKDDIIELYMDYKILNIRSLIE